MKKKQVIMTMAMMGVVASMAVGCGKKDATTDTTVAPTVAESSTEVETEVEAETPGETDASEEVTVSDAFAGTDFTVYKQAATEDDGETYFYGYVSDGEERLVYTANGPVILNGDGELSTGDYIKFTAKDVVGLSYPAQMQEITVESIDKADATVDDGFFTDMQAALPEKTENEDGTITYAAMMWQSWNTADNTWMVKTHDGKRIADVSGVEDVRVGDLYYITFSGEEDKAIPATLLDVTKVELIEDDEVAIPVSDAISEAVLKYGVAINGPIDTTGVAVESVDVDTETEVNADNVEGNTADVEDTEADVEDTAESDAESEAEENAETVESETVEEETEVTETKAE